MVNQLELENVTRKKQSEGEVDTTIQISIETREKLKERGRKGETYEDVILRLMADSDKLGQRK